MTRRNEQSNQDDLMRFHFLHPHTSIEDSARKKLKQWLPSLAANDGSFLIEISNIVPFELSREDRSIPTSPGLVRVRQR